MNLTNSWLSVAVIKTNKLYWCYCVNDRLYLSQATDTALSVGNHSALFYSFYISYCRSQWPRGLRRRSAAARLLRSWVQIPRGAWMFVNCECCVLSGRGLCDELITHPEESYRLWCVVVCDLETSRIGAPYIHDISSLIVNDLTLILLTWRKW